MRIFSPIIAAAAIAATISAAGAQAPKLEKSSMTLAVGGKTSLLICH